MEKLVVVTITYHRNMHGNDFINEMVVRLFSTKNKAEDFLVKEGFLYGKPYPFNVTGWYHSKWTIHPNFDLYDIIDYISAEIEEAEVDQTSENIGITCCEHNHY